MATKPNVADLLAWWELDEASGDRADSYGAYTLTEHNGLGTAEGGANFNDADSDYLDNTSADLSWGDEEVTITGWIWLDDVLNDYAIVSRNAAAGDNRQFTFQYDAANNWFQLDVSDDGTTNDTEVTNSTKGNDAGEWIFFAFYHDPTGNEIGLRINATSQTAAHATGLSDKTGEPFTLGMVNDGDKYLDGKMKIVNVWNTLLTSDEQDYLYNSGSGISYTEFATNDFTGRVIVM